MKIALATPLFLIALLTAVPVAHAQEVPAEDAAEASILVEIEDDGLIYTPLNMSVEQLRDLTVVDITGQRIGGVERVLGSPSGEVTAVAVEVGGFLGIGARDVIMALNSMTLSVADNQLVLDMSRESIEALPHWDP